MKQDYEKLSFAVGPVQSGEEVLEVASHNAPYFRTAEFSAQMKETEGWMLNLADAPKGSRVVFLTGSGTAGMEAAVLNTVTEKDRALIVNGGSFGHRFCDIFEALELDYTPITLSAGHTLTAADLKPFEGDSSYSVFVVNLGETSTGTLYDIDLIADFCRRNHLFLIVDAVSAFLADDFSVAKHDIGIMITGSQKALAVMPGVSLITLSPEGISRVEHNKVHAFYFDLKPYLKDGERGQTPFTPAVSTLLQIRARMEKIMQNGGRQSELDKTARLAAYFRSKIGNYPFELFSDHPSHAVTALRVTGKTTAVEIFETLKNEYDLFICPNGGDLRETVFRVGHIGALEEKDYDTLFAALDDMKAKGRLN